MRMSVVMFCIDLGQRVCAALRMTPGVTETAEAKNKVLVPARDHPPEGMAQPCVGSAAKHVETGRRTLLCARAAPLAFSRGMGSLPVWDGTLRPGARSA